MYLDPQLPSKSSGLDGAARVLELTEHRLRFAEDVASPMQEQVDRQRPQLCEIEVAGIAGIVARAAATSNVLYLASSEPASQVEVMQLARPVEELGWEIAGMRQDCDLKGKNLLLERDGLEMRLDATASQLLGVLSSLIQVHERLEQHL